MDIINIEGSCEQSGIELLCGKLIACCHDNKIKRFGSYSNIHTIVNMFIIAEKLANQNSLKAAKLRTIYSQVRY